jgi:hypothetical protein
MTDLMKILSKIIACGSIKKGYASFIEVKNFKKNILGDPSLFPDLKAKDFPANIFITVEVKDSIPNIETDIPEYIKQKYIDECSVYDRKLGASEKAIENSKELTIDEIKLILCVAHNIKEVLKLNDRDKLFYYNVGAHFFATESKQEEFEYIKRPLQFFGNINTIDGKLISFKLSHAENSKYWRFQYTIKNKEPENSTEISI